MPSMTDRCCKCCGKSFKARTADVKRGWARFCSKSCKAREQERRTGQHAAYCERQDRRAEGGHDADDFDVGHIFESGVFGHGQS